MLAADGEMNSSPYDRMSARRIERCQSWMKVTDASIAQAVFFGYGLEPLRSLHIPLCIVTLTLGRADVNQVIEMLLFSSIVDLGPVEPK